MANSSGNTGAEVVDVRRFFVSFAQRRSVRLCEEETNHHLFGMPFAFCKRSLPVHTFIAAENLGAVRDSIVFGNPKGSKKGGGEELFRR